MRASQRPAWPETPLYLDLPRENAALFLLTYAIISSCRGDPNMQVWIKGMGRFIRT